MILDRRLLAASLILGIVTWSSIPITQASELHAIRQDPKQPSPSAVDGAKAIFGTDDLIDVYQETNPQRLAWSKSVVGLIDDALLTDNGNGTFTIGAGPLSIGGDPPCPGEAFADQLQAARCTGFLVGPEKNIIATAAHCIDEVSIETTSFVFGFQMQDASTPVLTVPAANVYRGQELIQRILNPSNGTDWALVWIDRPVELPDAQPLPVTPSGTNGVSLGWNVGLIGHSAALPLKLSFGPNAVVGSLQQDFFTANVDSHAGNSGSPVVRSSNGVVIGMLVRGQPDVIDTGSCFEWNTLPEANPAQQDVQYAAHFESNIPKYGTIPGRAPARQLVNVSDRRYRFFGNAVAGVPDLTGDGRGDVVVGISAGSINHQDGKGAIAGTVYVFDGATGAQVHAFMTPYGPGHTFGRHVAGLSDLDGDGLGEVAVYVDDRTPPGDHSAYIYSGGTGALLRIVPIPFPGGGLYPTTSMTRIGDVDGDGLDDLIAANRTEANPHPSGGRVHLLNPATGALIRTLDSPTPQSAGLFGTGASRVPDVDGDGIDDVVVGALREGSEAGRAHLFSGATGALLRTLVEPSPAIGWFGAAVAGLSDVDGDGRGDVVVKQATDAGNRFYVFSGASGTFLHSVTVPSPHSDATALAAVDDFDGDGLGDFVVGTMEGSAFGLTWAGRAHVYSGADGSLIDVLVSGRPERGGFFGLRIAAVPDVDGDGHMDLVTSAVNEDPIGIPIDDGRAHLHVSALTPACGNGLLEPGEACDDSNTTDGDCCSATCQPESGQQPGCDDGIACTVDACDAAGFCVGAPDDGACDDGSVCSLDVCNPQLGCEHIAASPGTECRAAAGACDVAEHCDGVSSACPADGGLPDSDGDSVCDAQDACTNIGNGQDFKLRPAPKVILSRIHTDVTPGNDKLTLQGVFDLGAGASFAALEPATTGARVLLLDQAGGVELDATLPGGLYAGSGTRGWRTNATGTRWQYLDRTRDGSASTYGSVTQLLVTDRSKRSPREVMVKVQGKNGTYPIVSADSPVQAIVVLGGQAEAVAGVCGESAFAAGECAFNGAGNALKCQQR